MEVDMESSPSYFDPKDLSTRETFRRYGKKSSTSSKSPQQDGLASRYSEGRMPNAALFLEDVKQEIEGLDYREGTPSRTHSAYKKRSPGSQMPSEFDAGIHSSRRGGSYSMKACKTEEDVSTDGGEATFAKFATLLDSCQQGLLSFPDLILQFEESCRGVSESIRCDFNGRHRIVEDRLMKQRAQFLLEEAASWSLLWYLFGKENEVVPEHVLVSPATSHLVACQFVLTDHDAQLCLRVVNWLEGLASKALDLENKVRGSHVGTYLPSSGIWHNTQRHLKKGRKNSDTVLHLDFDAPTRENAHLLADDSKQDESLLEDIWTLLRAGRYEEAGDLCRAAGQPWRAATLCPFGGMNLVPSIEALLKNRRNRTLQAIELESGVARQWQLWKWATYCTSERIANQDGKYEAAVYAAQCSNLKRMLPVCTDWESACWAMAKSWLDAQVDIELAQSQLRKSDQLKSYEDSVDESPGRDVAPRCTGGPDIWPMQVLNQQPRHLYSFLQKLHSSDVVHEAVSRGCKEQHRQIEMKLMSGHIPQLLDLLWSWISPSPEDQNVFRPHGDPQLIRFAAHLVLVLRVLLGDEIKDVLEDKLMNIGDLILHIYVMFLFSQEHEELVGIYASQLARHRCIDLYVHMMELRLNASVHVKYKLFLSAMEYLPFCPLEDSRASFEEIIESVLIRSRETKITKQDNTLDVAEQHRLQSLEKAMVIQWLCFTPPITVPDVEVISSKLLHLALIHSNILFREFALISMWRIPEMPIGAHKLLSFLAEPLKQLAENSLSIEDIEVSDDQKEFADWREYYSCDATYRNWLKIEVDNGDVSSADLSQEEKKRAIQAAKETLISSLLLLERKENPWLVIAEGSYDATEPVFLELQATAKLCLPSGECLPPDATVCATLMSALYAAATEELVSNRQLTVNVVLSPRDSSCIEVELRCLAVEGDGLGPPELNDGGVLATVMVAGFKGELPRFQAGVTMDISRLDAFYRNVEGPIVDQASYIVQGLCRRCCLPELILRCMQVSVSLAKLGEPPECHDKLIELVACPESGYCHLFSQQQLQDLLLISREYSIHIMELEEGDS